MEPDESYLITNSVNLLSDHANGPVDVTKDKCSPERSFVWYLLKIDHFNSSFNLKSSASKDEYERKGIYQMFI